MSDWCLRRILISVCFAVVALHPCSGVEIKVRGVGWREDIRLANTIEQVVLEEGSAYVATNHVEDAMRIVLSSLERKGFLDPEIHALLFRNKVEVERVEWVPDGITMDSLKRADLMTIEVEPGIRSYVEHVSFEGLEHIAHEVATGFFRPTAYLFVPKRDRAFSRFSMSRGVESLRASLIDLGFADAVVDIDWKAVADVRGAMDLRVKVTEGERYHWQKVNYVSETEDAEARACLPASSSLDGYYSRESEQDLVTELRRAFYAAGYPDVRMELTREIRRDAEMGAKLVEVTVRVIPGDRIRLGSVVFEGLEHTDVEFLRSVADIGGGEWLNRLEVESAQFRLGRLGIFKDLRVDYEDSEAEAERDVVFTTEEGIRREVNLLMGYGSYEQFRGGLEVRYFNLFGRAHQGTMRLRQSFKSSAGQLQYSVPEMPWIFDRGQARLQGIRREEVSFVREEALMAFGLEQYLRDGRMRLSAEYRFELLRSLELETLEPVGDDSSYVGSVLFGFSWDRRDRVVSPTEGFDIRSQLELASNVLGSASHFQRWVIGGSWHHPLGDEAILLHLGFEHGVLGRILSEVDEVPINKRFFPGGENSIRGYQDGEASPLDSIGESVGAEVYLMGHVELEFGLLRGLSSVLFVDAITVGQSLSDYPGNEFLWSVGLGLRYQTPLGPLRAEYGYNPDPREFDPEGTFHLSIGFPF